MEKMLLNSKVPFLQRTKYQLVWFKFSLTPLTSVCWASTPLQQLLLCYTLCCWPKTDAGQVDGLILSGRKCKWLPGGGHQWGTQAKTWILQYSKGEKVEVLTSFLFLGSKITADGDCSHEVRRRLLLGRKAMTNLDSVLKNRRYSADKGPYSQGYGVLSSHVWLWELDHKEGRTPKNWCLQAVVLEKTPESPLNSKEVKPVNLKNWCWNWNSSILVTWYEQLTHWKNPWCWERLRAEGEEGWERDGWMASPMQWTWTWAKLGRWVGLGRPGVLQSMGSQRFRHDWVTEQQ